MMSKKDKQPKIHSAWWRYEQTNPFFSVLQSDSIVSIPSRMKYYKRFQDRVYSAIFYGSCKNRRYSWIYSRCIFLCTRHAAVLLFIQPIPFVKWNCTYVWQIIMMPMVICIFESFLCAIIKSKHMFAFWLDGWTGKQIHTKKSESEIETEEKRKR